MSRAHPICANACKSTFTSIGFSIIGIPHELRAKVLRSSASVARNERFLNVVTSSVWVAGLVPSGLARRLDNGLREPFGQHYRRDLWGHSAGLFLPIPRIV